MTRPKRTAREQLDRWYPVMWGLIGLNVLMLFGLPLLVVIFR